jgi:diguanylate cyclase (GGDEF)-like protein
MKTNWRTLLRTIGNLYRLRTDDPDLLRAQFDVFVRQLPLLYFMLACNTVAVAVSFQNSGAPVLADLFPLLLCGFSIVRAVWWWRRRYARFTIAQIRAYITNTSILAVVMAAAFIIWGLLLYPQGDLYARSHLSFFIAMTTIGCICSLMPLPSAAMGVATVGMMPFVAFGLITDYGHMRVEAINFGLVGTTMIYLLYRQHLSFADLIQSRRDLHLRQLETQKLSDENRRIAFTDPLSGLPNRRAILARIDEIHTNSVAEADALAVVYIDLDGFKVINDIHGHEFGDALIRRVGARLSSVCPANGMLVRMGGDEFAILIERAGATEIASDAAQRILSILSSPIMIGKHECHIGASVGVAVDLDGATTSYELLRRADAAMYRVKGAGKGGIQHYDPSFDAARDHRAQIERDLRRGLDNGEFDVAYQPLVNAEDGRIVGVEALVRWPRRPDGALVPDEFIEIAESCGLIHELGLFVLRRACADIGPRAGLDLSVNISPAQFRYQKFESEVAQVLSETGFPPERLQFEITEGYLIDHPDRARKAIDAFRALGVSVALDDFGTGFASLGYLQTYDFSCVKIDKSLVADLGKHARASLLISGMVFMGKGLDLKVVAEGVETEQQAAMLRLAGCHRLQGYHFGRPQPIADLLAALDAPMERFA